MRYISTFDSMWGHIFSGTHETITRFVYDTEKKEMLALQLMDGATGNWTDASDAEKADVLDSLVNANSEALEAPEDWGLAGSDEIPEWANENLPAPGI